MIDFRYHLISIVAVFLALGLGVLMGSLVADQAVVDRLENSVNQLQEDKQDLQEDVLALDNQLEADVRFADVAEDWLISGELDGETVVFVRIDGSDDRMMDGLRDGLEVAGVGDVVVITVTDKFRLAGEVDREQLALAIESSSIEARELRSEAADLLALGLATATQAGAREARPDATDIAARQLLRALEDAGFVSVEGFDVPLEGARLLFAGGSEGERPFDPNRFATGFADSVVSRGEQILIAEPSTSTWGLVEAIRTSEIEDRVTTVDHAETIAGRIAVVLGLVSQADGENGHFGIGAGSEQVIPEPVPTG
jgi:hypothetical protein